MEKLRNFVGSFKGKNLMYIPTAGNGENDFEAWKKGDTYKLVKTLGAKLTVLQLEDYKFQDVRPKFKNVDIIWMGGGMPGYLLYWMRRFQLDKLFQTFGNDKIYVGSSAGSMVVSKTQYLSEIYPGEEDYGASVIPGLGLVNFEIWPHFKDSQMKFAKKNWKFNIPLYLLKDGEAITVVDGKVKVLGEERIIKN